MVKVKEVVMKIDIQDIITLAAGILYLLGFTQLFLCGYSSFQLYLFHLTLGLGLILSIYMDKVMGGFLFIIGTLFVLFYWKLKDVLIIGFFFDIIIVGFVNTKSQWLLLLIFALFIILFGVGILLFDHKYIIMSEYMLVFYSLSLGFYMWRNNTHFYILQESIGQFEGLLIFFQFTLIPFSIGCFLIGIFSWIRWNIQKLQHRITLRSSYFKKQRWY